MSAPDEVTVTVLSRDPCPLCEEAVADVEAVRERVAADVAVDLSVVDVDADPALREEYGERVPYVLVEGTPTCKYRVDRDRLAAAVEAAAEG